MDKILHQLRWQKISSVSYWIRNISTISHPFRLILYISSVSIFLNPLNYPNYVVLNTKYLPFFREMFGYPNYCTVNVDEQIRLTTTQTPNCLSQVLRHILQNPLPRVLVCCMTLAETLFLFRRTLRTRKNPCCCWPWHETYKRGGWKLKQHGFKRMQAIVLLGPVA